jgi:hypothetical protein
MKNRHRVSQVVGKLICSRTAGARLLEHGAANCDAQLWLECAARIEFASGMKFRQKAETPADKSSLPS